MGCNVTCLGDLSIDGGKYGIAAPAVEYDPQLPAYLRISDINDDGTLNTTDRKSVANPSAKNYMLKRGDIVFARTGGSTGRNYYYDERDGNFAFAGFLIKFSLDPTKVNPRFIKYYTQSKPYWNWICSFNTGSTRGNINAKTLADMPIPLPSQPVQNAIVSICDSISEKIRVNNRLNGYLEDLLLAMFSSLRPNESWSCGTADSFFSIGIGKTPPRKEPHWFTRVDSGGTIWLSIKDMGSEGAYVLDSSEHLTNDAVQQKRIRIAPAGSVLLSFKLTVGRVKIAANDMTTNEAIACFSSNDTRKLAYIYPYLRTYDYSKLGSTSSIATAVNSKTIKAMPIELPGSEELETFYQQSAALYSQMLSNAKESNSLSKLRDTLLPKLMSGEIDVSKVDLTQLNSHLVEHCPQSFSQ